MGEDAAVGVLARQSGRVALAARLVGRTPVRSDAAGRGPAHPPRSPRRSQDVRRRFRSAAIPPRLARADRVRIRAHLRGLLHHAAAGRGSLRRWARRRRGRLRVGGIARRRRGFIARECALAARRLAWCGRARGGEERDQERGAHHREEYGSSESDRGSSSTVRACEDAGKPRGRPPNRARASTAPRTTRSLQAKAPRSSALARCPRWPCPAPHARTSESEETPTRCGRPSSAVTQARRETRRPRDVARVVETDREDGDAVRFRDLHGQHHVVVVAAAQRSAAGVLRPG